MTIVKFARFLLTMLLVATVLSACGTPDHRSIPERATGFTKHVLIQDACPYGVIEEKSGVSSDSSYEYRASSRYGRDEELRFRQSGFKDAKCAPKPKDITPTKPVLKPGAKK